MTYFQGIKHTSIGQILLLKVSFLLLILQTRGRIPALRNPNQNRKSAQQLQQSFRLQQIVQFIATYAQVNSGLITPHVAKSVMLLAMRKKSVPSFPTSIALWLLIVQLLSKIRMLVRLLILYPHKLFLLLPSTPSTMIQIKQLQVIVQICLSHMLDLLNLNILLVLFIL